MSNVETFKQPFLGEIQKTLNEAVSIAWEGCHKIYITMDTGSHDQQIEWGYSIVYVENKDEALNQLWEWWDVSCGLKFITIIKDKITFDDLISQFQYDEV